MDDDLPTKPQNEMQARNDNDTVWLVSFADNDDRELTSEQIGKALAAGEIVLTTIVWREGMADWKPIIEVVELRAAVQKQRIIRKRSTVMGGFATPPPAPTAVTSPAATPAAPVSPQAAVTPQPPAALGRPSVQRPPPAAAPPAAAPPRAAAPPNPPAAQPAGSPVGTTAAAGSPAGAPRPQAATTVPARGAATLMGAPQPAAPIAAQAAKIAPRASVTVAAPRPAAPRVEPPEPEEEDLGSSVLESVPPPPEAPYRERINTLSGPGGDRPRTTLTGPAPAPPRAATLEPDPDLEPISLMPESLAPDTPAPESLETIGSDELQSMVEQVPPDLSPGQGPTIFEIELGSASELTQEIDVDMDVAATKEPPQVRAAQANAGAAPNVRVFAPEAAPARTGQAVSAQPAARVASRVPSPPRPVHAPLPQAVDPLADLEEAPEKKKGGFGKFLIAALVLAFCGGAFYLGRRTADPNAPGGAPSSSVAALQTPSAAPPASSTADTAPAQTATAELSAADSAPVGADVAAVPDEPAEVREPQQGGGQNPRTPQRGTPPGELTEEPSAVTEPEKPAPTPKEPPSEEESSEGAGPFNQDAAAAALAQAASQAGSCRSASDPSGVAQVSVTFSPSGRATRAIVNGPPFAGTATGGCIASKMTTARIPAFTGSRVTVKKKVVIQ